MKKITFVEKEDNSSYDPVNTFFSKTKASSVAKPSVNSSKQTNSSKTPVEKSIQAKKQKANFQEQAKQSIPQKIGQKGGSGYIPKKVPGFQSTSYENVREETIYDLKQKQSESRKNQRNFGEKTNSTKKNFMTEKKPDMVFDVPKVNYDEGDEGSYLNTKQEIQNDEQSLGKEGSSKQINKNKLPEIKSPNVVNVKNQGQINTFQKPPVPKFENPPQRASKATVKDKYFNQLNEENGQNTQEREQKIDIKAKPEAESGKRTMQNQRQKLSSSLQKPNSSKHIINPASNKIKQAEESQKEVSQQPKQKNSSSSLQQRVKELQLYEKEYQSKIQYLEQRIQTLTKIEQKYNKLSKDHKLCQQKSKDINQMSKQLQETKESIQKFMSDAKVPYSKKRQYLLLNQINQLKRANRQLVLRIKNYKGTDLMEMAISKNTQEISREFEIDYQEQYNKLNTDMESNLSILVNKVYEYLDIKSGKSKKTTKEEITFEKQQKFLLELNSIAEKISLTYLQKYQVSPLPKCNQECMNLYAEIQKERANIFSNFKINQLTDKEELNFAITENNLQIINDLQENFSQIISIEEKVLTQLKSQQKEKPSNRPNTSYGAQNKNASNAKILLKKVSLILELFKKRSSISTAFHIQSICYFTFMKEIMDKKLKKLQKELVNLYGRIKQMKDIYDLGGNTAKESLYLYLETHLQNFSLIVPNLQCDIKEVRSTYQEISKGIQRKITINKL